MSEQLEQKIDQILLDMENGIWTADLCLPETQRIQPVIHDYLFADDNDFLTIPEKNQLIFLHAILWKIKSVKDQIVPQAIEDLEEEYWNENEDNNFPFDSEHPKLDALPDEIVAVVLDCCDSSIHGLSEIGAEWILIKGLVLASLLV